MTRLSFAVRARFVVVNTLDVVMCLLPYRPWQGRLYAWAVNWSEDAAARGL